MQTMLHRNTQRNPSLKYFMEIDLSDLVIHPQRVTIAIHHHLLTTPQGILRELYTADIAGFRLQAGNVHNIQRLVQKFIPALVSYARLPDYVFVGRRSQHIYPVYTVGDEVIATTPGGPVFRHVELAKVRAYLMDYLVTTGELAPFGQGEKLHVRGVSRSTLTLLRPVFYLKKRVPGQTEFWAPVFEAEDGRSIYAYVASAKREVPIEDGYEVLALWDICAEALIADQRLQESYDLRPDRLMPHYWARLEATLEPERYRLVVSNHHTPRSDIQLPLYRNDRVAIALEVRSTENRFGLFIGRDAEDLRERVARDLVRRGLIDSPEGVRIAPLRHENGTSLLDRLLRTPDSTHSTEYAMRTT